MLETYIELCWGFVKHRGSQLCTPLVGIISLQLLRDHTGYPAQKKAPGALGPGHFVYNNYMQEYEMVICTFLPIISEMINMQPYPYKIPQCWYCYLLKYIFRLLGRSYVPMLSQLKKTGAYLVKFDRNKNYYWRKSTGVYNYLWHILYASYYNIYQ